MSKLFYKDIKVIKFCKVCKISCRFPNDSFFSSLGLCYKHRRDFYRDWRKKVWWPWFKKQLPEVQKKYRDSWNKWVEKNIDRRRKIALRSYHRRKFDSKNKARKHRATKKF